MTMIDALTQAAKPLGIHNLFFHREHIQRQSVSLFERRPHEILLSDEALLYIEGEYEGFVGSAFTEGQDPAQAPALLEMLRQTAQVNRIPFKPHTLRQHAAPDPFAQTDLTAQIPLLLEIEARMYTEARGLQAATLSAQRQHRTVCLMDGHGISMTDHMGSYSCHVRAIARGEADVQTAMGLQLAARWGDPLQLATQVAWEASALLGAGPCVSGQYPVILRADAFSEILQAFLPIFYAERVQSGMSPATGKLGQTIGSGLVTLYEDPSRIVTRSFDDEGTATLRKPLLECGRLETFLYNNRTAQKDGVASTGNGLRKQYRAAIATSSTCLVLQGGSMTLDALVRQMGNGLLITECDGVFAGANPTSGDFSLLSKGFLVRNGAMAQPVSQITIGGNFFGLLAGIDGVASDYASTDSPFDSLVQAPSVLVSHMRVSGR